MIQNTIKKPQSLNLSPPLVDTKQQGDTLYITISGNWTINQPQPSIDAIIHTLLKQPLTTIAFNTYNLGIWDSSILVIMTKFMTIAKNNKLIIQDKNVDTGIKNLTRLALATPPNTDALKNNTQESFSEYVGKLTLYFPQIIQQVLAFIGEITLAIQRLFIGKSSCTISNVWVCIQECGIEALPIVSLISMLVGLILAFVGVVQLRMFGAEIYVSSLVAVGMTRIMGAIMTGIILAGRTGAAYAAVIGTMEVNEEIDALTTLGIIPSDFLVMPRLIALTCMTPLLVVYADFMGMLGGFLVGVAALGIEPLEYITFTQKGFVLNNLWVGIIHGIVFGVIVAITGCYQGLRCERSAAAVGLATTSAVVYSIVGIVIATALLTILFNILGI